MLGVEGRPVEVVCGDRFARGAGLVIAGTTDRVREDGVGESDFLEFDVRFVFEVFGGFVWRELVFVLFAHAKLMIGAKAEGRTERYLGDASRQTCDKLS